MQSGNPNPGQNWMKKLGQNWMETNTLAASLASASDTSG